MRITRQWQGVGWKANRLPYMCRLSCIQANVCNLFIAYICRNVAILLNLGYTLHSYCVPCHGRMGQERYAWWRFISGRRKKSSSFKQNGTNCPRTGVRASYRMLPSPRMSWVQNGIQLLLWASKTAHTLLFVLISGLKSDSPANSQQQSIRRGSLRCDPCVAKATALSLSLSQFPCLKWSVYIADYNLGQ